MSDTSQLDINEKVNFLFKNYLGFPNTDENLAYYEEVNTTYSNYILARDVFVSEIPQTPVFNTSKNSTDVKLSDSNFCSYENAASNSSSIMEDSLFVVRRYIKLKLTPVPGSNNKSYYCLDNQNDNVLQGSIQFNEGDNTRPYLYYLYKTDGTNIVGDPIPSTSDFGNWIFDVKNGVIHFTDYSGNITTLVNDTKPPALTFYKYIGVRGIGGGRVIDADEDTVIYAEKNADEDKLRFYTAGSEKMIVDTDGKVGMGTSTPSVQLHIQDNTNIESRIETTNGWAQLTLISNGNHSFINYNNDLHFFESASNTKMIIKNNTGNVGIGTPSPSSKLDVNGSIRGAYNTDTTSYLGRAAIGYNSSYSDFASFSHIDRSSGANYALMQNSDGDTYINASSGRTLYIRENDVTKITLKNGKVGIKHGDITPTYILHIDSTDAILLPKGTDNQRPSSVTAGLIRYNTQSTQFEGYSNSAWQGLGGVIDIDQDTKILAELNSDEDKLRFYTDGSERMIIDKVGNIGIGTTSPDVKLEVYTANTSNYLRVTRNDVGYIQLGVVGGLNVIYSRTMSSSPRELGLEIGTTRVMTLDTNYRVGIGTTSPITTLDIRKSGGARLRLENSNTSHNYAHQDESIEFCTDYATAGFIHQKGEHLRIGVTGNSSSIKFYTSSTTSSGYNAASTGTQTQSIFDGTYTSSNDIPRMIIAGNGNVGIGTDSPQSKLHVNGDIKVMGGISFRDTNTSYNGTNKNCSIHAIGSNDELQYNGYDGHHFTTNGSATGTNMVERLTIIGSVGGSNAGYVGIGATSPYHKLEISDGLSYPYSSSHNHYKETGAVLNINTSTWSSAIKIVGSHTHSVGVYDLYNTQSNSWTGNSRTDGATFNRWSHFSYYGDLYFRHYYNSSTTSNSRNVLVLKHDGNVGIGITSPNHKLHVNGNTLIGDVSNYASGTPYTDAQLTLGGTHNAGYNVSNKVKLLIAGGNNDSSSPYYIVCEDENAVVQFFVKGATDGSTGNNGICHIKGKVGIGTTSPSTRLMIEGPNGSSGYGICIKRSDTGAEGKLYMDSDYLNLLGGSSGVRIRGGNEIFVRSSGVGINYSSPGSPLDVRGSFSAENQLCIRANGLIRTYTANSAHKRAELTNSNGGGRLQCYNGYDNTGTSTIRVRISAIHGENSYINNSGNLGIGTNPSKRLHVYGDAVPVRIQNAYGYLDLGTQNSTYCHITTDRSHFYFNQKLWVDGNIYRYGANNWHFGVDGGNHITIKSNGYVGINQTNPSWPLTVSASSATSKWWVYNVYYSGSPEKYHNPNGWAYAYGTFNVGLQVSGAIYTSVTYLIYSDERIKKDIREIPDDMSLQLLRDISCVYYSYRDKRKGEGDTMGFIAQQVAKHLPMAVTYTSEYIPNETRTLFDDISWSTVICYKNETEDDISYNSTDFLNEHEYDNSGNKITEEKYKLTIHDLSNDICGQYYKFGCDDEVDMENESLHSHMFELPALNDDPKSFIFDKIWDDVFLYGKLVDDFHGLDKMKLFTLNFSATQEIDKIQREEKVKLETAETKIQTLETQLNTSINKIQTLETQLNTSINKIQTLETQVQSLTSLITELTNRINNAGI